MRIKAVTVTGADDSIDPMDIFNVSNRYPFIEWGILFSFNRQGSQCFPSDEWLRELRDLWNGPAHNKPKLSAHLCGTMVTHFVEQGNFSFGTFYNDRKVSPIFKRLQLNFHGRLHQQCENFGEVLAAYKDRYQVIFQFDSVNDRSVRPLVSQELGVPLFGMSGEADVSPAEWPRPIKDGLGRLEYCGYAGGLGPDSIHRELARIEKAAEGATIWIDMESKLRSEDGIQFDLNKVDEVAGIVEHSGLIDWSWRYA